MNEDRPQRREASADGAPPERKRSDEPRVNERIRVREVRVVDADGTQLGVMATADALAAAQERGLDLVEVAPNSTPPVVRIQDYGQYKYEKARRERDAKRRGRSAETKEIRMSPTIGNADFETKVRQALGFLADGDRVKVAVRFKGRMITHTEIGAAHLARFTELLAEAGAPDRPALLEGKSLAILFLPIKKA
jgi:translation initiation factor IF-3